MKKLIYIIVILFVIFIVTGCNNSPSTAKTSNNHLNIDVTHYEYNGHMYQAHHITGSYGFGVIHDPDCHCLKDSIK